MHVPPLIPGPYGLDLDYSALLLFDSILIDKDAKRFVDSANVKIFTQLKESLHILEEEGKAQFIDFAAITQRTSKELEAMLQSELRDPTHWLASERKAIRLNALRGEFFDNAVQRGFQLFKI